MYVKVFADTPKNVILTSFNRLSNQDKINLIYMYDHNAKILFGTDTPSSPIYGNRPGYNGFLEMLEMENAGNPLSKILASETIANAKAFNLDKMYGTVVKGKKANLLMLNKNPLQDITAYNVIYQMIISGTLLNRNEFFARILQEKR